MHDRPTTPGVAQDIARHFLQLAFAKKNRVAEPGKPEGCRAVDFNWRGHGEIGLGAGDLETSDDFAEWGAQPFVNPDDAGMETEMVNLVDVVFSIANGKMASFFTTAMEKSRNLQIAGKKNACA